MATPGELPLVVRSKLPEYLALSVSLPNTVFVFKLRLHFFDWSRGTLHRPTKAQKHVNSILPLKKYFAIMFSVINFQFSTNKLYPNRP